jgi:predicted O-methyltransferase YrrM
LRTRSTRARPGSAKSRRSKSTSSKRRAGRSSARNSSAPAFSAEAAARWFDGKIFATDWTSWHFPNWAAWLAPYRHRALRVLEIGSWEGRSALFFLNHLPRARLVCLDTFEGGQEHQAADDAETFLPQVEKRFDANTAEFSKRVEKIRARSADGLIQLGLANRRFDIAYIDGSHRAGDVYSDGALTWPLMERGGLVIFDDYQWKMMPDKLDNPKPGIDAFLKAYEGRYRIVHKKYQVAIVKL